jgi:hypothetical protein
MKMEGRVVPTEKLCFGRREVDVDFKCDWTRAATNEEVLKAVEIRNWLCVYPANKESIVARFAELANESARKIGIRISEPMTVALRDDRADTYYNEIKKNLNENVTFLFFYYFLCFYFLISKFTRRFNWWLLFFP